MLSSDFIQLGSQILLVVGAILPVVNPLGDAPLFLHMTRGCDDATRAALARRISIYSFALLLGSLFIGSLVLRLFALSIPVVQVAGGAVVCSLGWKMLGDSPKPAEIDKDPHKAQISAMEHTFYPLTLPLTVDPGAMAVAVTVGANHSHSVEFLTINMIAATIGTVLMALIIYLTYRFARRVSTWIGHTGTVVMVRLSAFIVVCIGVQISWNGIKGLLLEVGIHP